MSFNQDLNAQVSAKGIQLISSNRRHVSNTFSLKELINQPFNVYFLDLNSQIQFINNAGLESNHFMSLKDAKNRTVLDYVEKKSACETIEHDKRVIKSKSHLMAEQELLLSSGALYHYVTVKLPWYNEDNRLVGLLGCSAALIKQPISIFIKEMASLGLVSTTNSLNNYLTLNDAILSKREKDCLYYLIRGKTAKSIGQILGLSPRTVEHYLANLKCKLSVNTKEELIEKALDLYLPVSN